MLPNRSDQSQGGRHRGWILICGGQVWQICKCRILKLFRWGYNLGRDDFRIHDCSLAGWRLGLILDNKVPFPTDGSFQRERAG